MPSLDKALSAASTSDIHKTRTGAVLWVLAGFLTFVQDAIPVFPDATWLNTVAEFLEAIIGVIQWLSTWAGGLLLTVGPLDKVRKFFKALF